MKLKLAEGHLQKIKFHEKCVRVTKNEILVHKKYHDNIHIVGVIPVW